MAISKGVRDKVMGRALTSRSVASIPIEWMGPPAWRLPSGKALAEFALQAGFLAPLLLGDGPFWRQKRTGAIGTAVHRTGTLGENRNGLEQ